MDTKGGRFTIDINGRTYSGRGEAKIKPARAVPKNGVNWDGSGYNTVEPKLAAADLTFDRGLGLTWEEGEILRDLNVTFVETDAGRTHYWTNANWEGEPEINSKDGEVSGMSIMSDQYRCVNN